MVCPGNKLRWDLTANEIAKRTDALVTTAKAIYDAVGAITDDEANYENVIEVFTIFGDLNVYRDM